MESEPRLQQHAALFQEHRAHLFGVAYRMLASVSDADDVLQEAFLRFSRVELTTVEVPQAFLTRMLSRLCLDHMRSSRRRRESYVGPWLPEPVLTETGVTGENAPEYLLRDDLSMAMLVAMERLSPLERAAFILRDVFDLQYAEVAGALQREVTACRALVTRARKHVRERRPRYEVSEEESRGLLMAFTQAISDGDVSRVQEFLTADARLVADGGGRVSSATKILDDPQRMARFLVGVQKRFDSYSIAQYVHVGGQPGLLVQDESGVRQVCAFTIVDGKIAEMYVVRNPDKLRHLADPGRKAAFSTMSTIRGTRNT